MEDMLIPQVPRKSGSPIDPHSLPSPHPEPSPLQKADPETFEPRPGDRDEGEGRLPQIPSELIVLSEKDVPLDTTPLEEELARADALLSSEPQVFGLPSLLGQPLVGLILLGVSGLLGLFLFNQITTTLASLATQPVWIQYTGITLLSLLGLAILYSLGRVVLFYFRLRRNKQLRIRGLQELEERSRLRWLVNAKKEQAFESLLRYLKEYPIAQTDQKRKALAYVGISGERLFDLEEVRSRLLVTEQWADTDSWLQSFRMLFQRKLDEAAQERIRYWARRAAFATAVSPNTLVDTGATLYCSLAMVGDLCRIYHLRASRLATGVILVRVFTNSYLSGQFNEAEGWTADQISQLVEPHLPTSEIALGKIFGRLGAKASQGAINYLLLSRLGKYTMKTLQPVNDR
ncbi:MAG: YcjF family protein [Gemmataceae bacterium]|jgi:uncharacterized membrane protein YcjF (UPF0283 family)|nr:YcjF family protein [Gemmataceae bacterium]